MPVANVMSATMLLLFTNVRGTLAFVSPPPLLPLQCFPVDPSITFSSSSPWLASQWCPSSSPSFSSSALHQSSEAGEINSSDIQAKLQSQMAKLQERDRSSKAIAPDDLDIIYSDDHLVLVNKPSGILTVPGPSSNNPSLNDAVFQKFSCESQRMDKMVVHRLGMDTSGLVVFARTNVALREMNALFRTRKVVRKYEALVCGHFQGIDGKKEGEITLPLMRDYEYPPYMRVSTDQHQRALIGLDPAHVGKKLLESPKESITHYSILSHEQLNTGDTDDTDKSEGSGGLDVTRLTLTSISGRTHQLNVHCAAIGHPIVGDTVYGYNGEAAPNGGLEERELPEDRASEELQKKIAEACAGSAGSEGTPGRPGMGMCVHAKLISFRHPVTGEVLEFECDAPF